MARIDDSYRENLIGEERQRLIEELQHAQMSEVEREAIDRTNALALLPRLRG